MKKDLSSQSMDAVLQDFLGNKPSMETSKLEPQPADTQEQASKAEQGQAAETMPEQADETPQVIRRGFFPLRSVHRRPQARVPQPQHARCPRPHRPHVRRAQDERFGTGGEHRPAASCHLR